MRDIKTHETLLTKKGVQQPVFPSRTARATVGGSIYAAPSQRHLVDLQYRFRDESTT